MCHARGHGQTHLGTEGDNCIGEKCGEAERDKRQHGVTDEFHGRGEEGAVLPTGLNPRDPCVWAFSLGFKEMGKVVEWRLYLCTVTAGQGITQHSASSEYLFNGCAYELLE